MQVKMLRAVVAGGEPRKVGDVVELADAEAQAAVQSGAAEQAAGPSGGAQLRVRLIEQAWVDEEMRQKGEELDLPEKEALALIADGLAVRAAYAGAPPVGTQYATDPSAEKAAQDAEARAGKRR